MKKISALLLIVVCYTGIYAQTTGSTTPESTPKKFTTGITIFNDFWQGDYTNMTPKWHNQGVDFFGQINIPMEKTRMVFSVGAGIGVHNLYSDAFLQKDSLNVYQFVKIKDIDPDLDYKNNKMTVAYMDFPFEFRYKHKTGFKIAAGMKFGFVLGSHVKYKGDDYLTGGSETIKVKFSNLDHLEKWRYGVTGKIGYKFAELYAYYGLTKIFQKDKGPDLYPVSIGISLRPF